MIFAVLTTLGLMLDAIPASELPNPSLPEVAACFNDSNNDGKFGVWIYEGHSDWRKARDNPKGVLVFGFEPGKTEYQESELQYCWYSADVPNGEFSRCTSGRLQIVEFRPPEAISGRYSFMLENGTEKTREFDASYCEKRQIDDVPHNPALKLTVRPVTTRACARPAPARPAA